MEKNDIQQLLQQYLDHRLSEADAARLRDLLSDESQKEDVVDVLNGLLQQTNADAAMVPEAWKDMHKAIVAVDKPAPVRRIYRRWLAAASVIILLAVGAYLYNDEKEASPPKTAMHDVAPGRDGAILTLADGRKLILDSLGNGMVTTQNGVNVMMKDGELQYSGNGEPVYNTMTTPRGRQFHVRLPDGTMVWLNAASSITYPTAFTGNSREVSITGEVYFEVTKDANKPFKVKGRMPVEVLGTHFNMNTYEDETAAKTTLLEGAVKTGNIILKPGQQAIQGATLTVAEANISKVMAWKNGLFNFEDATLEEVLRQLQRWYDIEVVYAGKVKNIQFFGEMNKNVPLSVVLEALQNAGVKFRIEGNRLIVMP